MTRATLTRPDGVLAELDEGLRWQSKDAAWAEMLNLGFDPRLSLDQPAGLPAYAGAVARAAEYYRCEASYPWTDAPAREGVVY